MSSYRKLFEVAQGQLRMQLHPPSNEPWHGSICKQYNPITLHMSNPPEFIHPLCFYRVHGAVYWVHFPASATSLLLANTDAQQLLEASSS